MLSVAHHSFCHCLPKSHCLVPVAHSLLIEQYPFVSPGMVQKAPGRVEEIRRASFRIQVCQRLTKAPTYGDIPGKWIAAQLLLSLWNVTVKNIFPVFLTCCLFKMYILEVENKYMKLCILIVMQTFMKLTRKRLQTMPIANTVIT